MSEGREREEKGEKIDGAGKEGLRRGETVRSWLGLELFQRVLKLRGDNTKRAGKCRLSVRINVKSHSLHSIHKVN